MPKQHKVCNLNKFGSVILDGGFTANAWRHYSIKSLWRVDLFKNKNTKIKKESLEVSNPLIACVSVIADDGPSAIRKALVSHKKDVSLNRKFYEEKLKEKKAINEKAIREKDSLASEG